MHKSLRHLCIVPLGRADVAEISPRPSLYIPLDDYYVKKKKNAPVRRRIKDRGGQTPASGGLVDQVEPDEPNTPSGSDQPKL